MICKGRPVHRGLNEYLPASEHALVIFILVRHELVGLA